MHLEISLNSYSAGMDFRIDLRLVGVKIFLMVVDP